MSVPDWMIDAPSPSVDDMATLIRRLVRSLRQAAPGHTLADQALDYLARVGMTGDVLRAPAEAPANEGRETALIVRDLLSRVDADLENIENKRTQDYKDADLDSFGTYAPATIHHAAIAARRARKRLAEARAALAAPAQGDAKVLADAGTPGPWFVRKHERDGTLHDCFVSAPDVQGMAYDAEIMGDDEYRDGIARKLADCELIVTAVNALRAARQSKGGAS